jgi:hypothetical protein
MRIVMSHHRLALAFTLLFLLLLAPLPAAAQEVYAFLITQMDLERDLLAEDLRQYAANRTARQEAATTVEASLVGIDEALENGLVTLGQLEVLENEVQTQEERLTVLQRQGTELRQRIFDRLRRTALLGERIDALRRTTRLQLDPVSGVWEMDVLPGHQLARLHLNLTGTVLNGTYVYLDGSATGSVRGIFAGDKITLERIDARRGFDSVWEGEIDPVRRELRGRWTATDLSGGGPGGGTWSARKLDDEELDEDGQGTDESAPDEASQGGDNP